MQCLPRNAGLQRRTLEINFESLSGTPLSNILSDEEQAFVQVSWRAGSRRGASLGLQKQSMQKTKPGQRFGGDMIIWSDGITHHDLDFSIETQRPAQRCLVKIKVMKCGSLGVRVLAAAEVDISDVFSAGHDIPAGVPHSLDVSMAASPGTSLVLSTSLLHTPAIPLGTRWRQGLDAILSGQQGLWSFAGSLRPSSSADGQSLCSTGLDASYAPASSLETTETDIHLNDGNLEAVSSHSPGLKRNRRSHRRTSSSGSDSMAHWDSRAALPAAEQGQRQQPWWASKGKRVKLWALNEAYDDSAAPLHRQGATDDGAPASSSSAAAGPLRRWLSSLGTNSSSHQRLPDSPSKLSEASGDSCSQDVQLAEFPHRHAVADGSEQTERAPGSPRASATVAIDDDEVLQRVLLESACMAGGLTDSSRGLWSAPSSLSSHSWAAPASMSMGEPLGQGWFSKQLRSRGEAAESVSASLDVFYATTDQRSLGVGGAAACSSLAVSVSEWLMAHQRPPVVGGELDGILLRGSQQWRRLCRLPGNLEAFPDCHLDLETAVTGHAGDWSVAIRPAKSFVGFIRPSGLDCPALDDLLDGTMPLDRIWQEISREPDAATYIVGWNDHWFVVHAGGNRAFLIDTLGDKLCEGGDRAFVLSFPPSPPLVHEKAADPAASRLHLAEAGAVAGCQAFFEQFYLAASMSQLRQDLQRATDETGGWAGESIGAESVLRKLQIEFHRMELVDSEPH